MEKILVSACLVGDNTRYDGKNCLNEEVMKLNEKFDFVLVCPEISGGLSVPRPRAEIIDGKVFTEYKIDITKKYLAGIDQILPVVKYFHITKAILKENSPSCGVHKIHNGKFNGGLIDGQGLLTKKLLEFGVEVYSENDLDKLINNQ